MSPCPNGTTVGAPPLTKNRSSTVVDPWRRSVTTRLLRPAGTGMLNVVELLSVVPAVMSSRLGPRTMRIPHSVGGPPTAHGRAVLHRMPPAVADDWNHSENERPDS